MRSEDASSVSACEGRSAVPAGVPPAGALADALQALLPRLQGARRRGRRTRRQPESSGRLHRLHAQPLHLELASVTVSVARLLHLLQITKSFIKNIVGSMRISCVNKFKYFYYRDLLNKLETKAAYNLRLLIVHNLSGNYK